MQIYNLQSIYGTAEVSIRKQNNRLCDIATKTLETKVDMLQGKEKGCYSKACFGVFFKNSDQVCQTEGKNM